MPLWQYNIKTVFKETGREGKVWIKLPQDRVRRQAVLSPQVLRNSAISDSASHGTLYKRSVAKLSAKLS
jgi:hypothetical protein